MLGLRRCASGGRGIGQLCRCSQMATSRRLGVDEAGGLSPCHLRALPQEGVVHRRDQLIQVLVQPQDVEILHVRVWVVEVVAVSEKRRGGVVVCRVCCVVVCVVCGGVV